MALTPTRRLCDIFWLRWAQVKQTLLPRIVVHLAHRGFELEAAFSGATQTFAGFFGLLRAHGLYRITGKEFHLPEPIKGAHDEQD